VTGRQKALRGLGRYTLTVLLLGLFLFPVFTLLRASLMNRVELYARPVDWIPSNPAWGNFVEVLRPDHIVPVASALGNTAIVAIGASVLSLVLGAMAGYAFARLRFRGRAALLGAVFSVYVLPGLLFLIPLFVMFRAAGLLDTYPSLILPYTAWLTPFVIVIMRSYFLTLPRELEEAALIDGCSRLQIFARVVLPLSAPGLVAAFVSAFILAWNEFLTPLILTARLSVITTTLGQYTSTQDIELGQMAAAGVYSILPVVALTIVFQRYIRQGLVQGAVKG
jgi:multiple sugar transport system permease protein